MRLSTHLVDPCGKARRRADPHGQQRVVNGPVKRGKWGIGPVRGVVASYQWLPLLIVLVDHPVLRSYCEWEYERVRRKYIHIKWVSNGLVSKELVEASGGSQTGIGSKSVNPELCS